MCECVCRSICVPSQRGAWQVGLRVQVGNRWEPIFFKWLKLNSSLERTCELICWWLSKIIYKQGPGKARRGGKRMPCWKHSISQAGLVANPCVWACFVLDHLIFFGLFLCFLVYCDTMYSLRSVGKQESSAQ